MVTTVGSDCANPINDRHQNVVQFSESSFAHADQLVVQRRSFTGLWSLPAFKLLSLPALRGM
jgi:hypothetical protein